MAYIADVLELCMKSNEKVWTHGGDEIYDNPTEERQFAHVRIPICGQEQIGNTLTGKATMKSVAGHKEVLRDIRIRRRLHGAKIIGGDAADETIVPNGEAVQGVDGDTRSFNPEKTSYYSMMSRLQACRPFITSKGYVGIGPECMQAGDIVVIFKGAKLPYVLRATGNQYVLVGESYVQGIMYGELVKTGSRSAEFHII